MLKFTGWIPAALLAVVITVSACSDQRPSSRSPAVRGQTVIEQAQEAHGSSILDQAVVEFDFRGDHFTVRQNEGRFSYERRYVDSAENRVREVLTNDSLYQTINGARQNLSQSERVAVETAVNSVVYFALLPHPLSDPAVQPRYLDSTSVRGEPYHKVEVTFRKEGGGRDWEDRFVYWFHRDRYTIDYLAYYYHTSGGGSRFREAVNPRRVNGIRFADYINYRAAVDTLGTAVEQYDRLFEQGALEKVSEVRLEDVQVRSLE